MRNILVLGAGRSSSALISYLLHHSREEEWQVTVGDMSEQVACERLQNHPAGKAIRFDINGTDCGDVIAAADIVVSLLPANFHPIVARYCLNSGKHLLTASYVSDEMKLLHEEALLKNLLFLNECGLDPGIDHMSAMQVVDRIRNTGGKITSFESFTGGLIAPDTDPENPWRYKFTWNPRNVVMAGQSTARFLQQGKFKYIPYQQLFKRITPVHVPGFGNYEGYANRDSLKYIETYDLKDVKTMLRGTLRNKGFCSTWDIFVQLGCCDDSYEVANVSTMKHSDFLDCFMDGGHSMSAEQKLAAQFKLSEGSVELQCLRWSGFFSDQPVGLQSGTPAAILEHILNKKWKLGPEDKDQIVMWHRFMYQHKGKEKEIQASLVASGTDAVDTAMAKTVGLPLAIAARLVLRDEIKKRGVVIPIYEEFYNPILAELKENGIELSEIEI